MSAPAPTLLARRFPELARLPWTRIAEGPTPVERSVALAPYLGRDDVWMKRDDRVASLYGGNKIRRFEYLFAHAREKGRTTLVTAGGLASTQVLATVLHGRAHGFRVVATLFDQPVTDFAKEAIELDVAGGGEILHGGGYARTTWRGVRAYVEAKDAYLILPGASTPLAVMGYVDAMLELGEQVARGEAPRPDYVVVPTGSGGTLVGLAIGAAILGWPTVIRGARITERFACNRLTIGFLIASTLRFLRKRAPSFARLGRLSPRFELDHGVCGPGYGHATAEALEAIPWVERAIGVPGEVTYSGKGLHALKKLARERPGATLLYWQTLSSRRPALAPVALSEELRTALARP